MLVLLNYFRLVHQPVVTDGGRLAFMLASADVDEIIAYSNEKMPYADIHLAAEVLMDSIYDEVPKYWWGSPTTGPHYRIFFEDQAIFLEQVTQAAQQSDGSNVVAFRQRERTFFQRFWDKIRPFFPFLLTLLLIIYWVRGRSNGS